MNIVATDQQRTHWAYVVGGEAHQFRLIQAKLVKEGINIAGHGEMGREINVPKAATFVLVLIDMVSHPAVEKVKAQAAALDIPVVTGSFQSWLITRQQLKDRGYIQEEVYVPRPAPVAPVSVQGVTFRDGPSEAQKLALAAAAQNKPETPISVAPPREPEAPQPEEKIEPQPEPVVTEPVPAAAAETIQEKNDMGPKKKAVFVSEAAMERETVAREILKKYDGSILNTELAEAVAERTGAPIGAHKAQQLRIAMGYKPTQRGGGGKVTKYAEEKTAEKKAARVSKKAEKLPKTEKPPKAPVTPTSTQEGPSPDERAMYDVIKEVCPKVGIKRMVVEFDAEGKMTVTRVRERVIVENEEEQI